jgi:catechol 2,3-dioxygenase-like lactoylglutathione lyase family enzyme
MSPIQEVLMPSVMRVQHVSVPMPPGSQEQARQFYGAVLGMREKDPPSSLAAQQLVWFDVGDGGHEVHIFTDEAMTSNSSAQHLCLQVDSLADFRAQLADHEIEIEETTPITNRPRLFVHDPFGNLIEITQVLGEYD